MSPEDGGQKVDPLLEPFLGSLEDAEWERRLTPLVADHIQPVVRAVVRRRLGAAWHPEAERVDAGFADVGAEALVHVIARLRAMTRGAHPIADLRAYVAVTAFHACDDYLRRKYPQRARLKNRLRYALTHGAGLALWTSPAGDWLAGIDEWRGQAPAGGTSELQRCIENPRAFVEGWPLVDRGGKDAFSFLLRLLKCVGQPIELDTLVNVVADVWDVRDPTVDPDREGHQLIEQQLDPKPAAATAVERRLYLELLWAEICALPLRQRMAVLLSLRDEEGGGILSLFPLTGVASLRVLADALEMPAPALAALWNDLPLDDAAIAGRLGLTRQTDPVKVESDLNALVPKGRRTLGAHLLISLGRGICFARRPRCGDCPVEGLCPKIGV